VIRPPASKCEALSSNPSTAKKKKTKNFLPQARISSPTPHFLQVPGKRQELQLLTGLTILFM
jgi:hypothetical protein